MEFETPNIYNHYLSKTTETGRKEPKKGKEKAAVVEETTQSLGKPAPVHQKDKKPGLVQSKIEEFTAKFNPPAAAQGIKPPDLNQEKNALTLFPIFGRRPSSKGKGQGTSAVGNLKEKPGLVEIGEKGKYKPIV